MVMRNIMVLLCAALISVSAFAQQNDENVVAEQEVVSKEIIKTGLNYGPLPAVAFDADKGFQLGALLNIYNFGDGATYPNPYSQWYFEASFFTKGSQLFVVSYDNKQLIPGVRWSSNFTLTNDKAMDFYGFNGYMAHYDYQQVASGNQESSDAYIYTPMYRMNRIAALFKTDFTGNIWNNKLFWEAGYHLSYFKHGYNGQALNLDKINEGKESNKMFPEDKETLFDLYRKWGIISEEEAWGGLNSTLRLGLLYDTRDKEAAPSRGIWAEAHTTIAPKWLGTSIPYYRYSATFRQYLPIISNDVLTFAYRLNYEGTFGNDAPYYVLPYITVMGQNYDRDGMGGYRTIRGLMRNRVQGLDMASYNVEIRWRFVNFALFNQNISFGLSAFSDGTMVTRNFDMSFQGDAAYRAEYDEYMTLGCNSDRPHITVGGGLRFIMNQNFIVAFEYGLPISKFSSDPYIKGQDGDGAFYINTGYLF